ncbi:MAG: ABC transporter substrate-binding protein [Candidatus Rokuibacteriota bacterium]|nr:MAG: ABC transporter substrate-binding protein [Candidatus Rokubacteria bacterium]
MNARRDMLRSLTLATTAGVLGIRPTPAATAEPPPETTALRLGQFAGGVCIAPQYIAEEFLQGEGFTQVQYVKQAGRVATNKALASGDISITAASLGPLLVQIDTGDPITIVSGVHVGCFALFATERIRTLRDLKGKTVSVTELGTGRHVFLAAAMAYVGLDPRRDVHFAVHPPAESIQLLADGKIDGYQAFAEEVAELRAKKIGHVILDSTTERPWSQYFCCMTAMHRDFVRNYPAATKRALRAILKATTVCALEPDRVARLVVDKGYATDYEYARQTLRTLPYTKWRDYDPEDTVRFHAVRLHEAGMVKSTPQKLIAQGTDWRFLNELKKEMKG